MSVEQDLFAAMVLSELQGVRSQFQERLRSIAASVQRRLEEPVDRNVEYDTHRLLTCIGRMFAEVDGKSDSCYLSANELRSTFLGFLKEYITEGERFQYSIGPAVQRVVVSNLMADEDVEIKLPQGIGV